MKNAGEISFDTGEPTLKPIAQQQLSFIQRLIEALRYKARYLPRFKPFILGLVTLFLIIALVSAKSDVIPFITTDQTSLSGLQSNDSLSTVEPLPTVLPESSTPSPSPTATPTKTTRTAAGVPIPTSKPTTLPTAQPTPTPSPTPTPRIKNPPVMNLGYPNELQQISMTPSQTLCAVDTPAGGNTAGLQRRHQHNDGTWTSYASHFVLCWDPPDGPNTLRVQYKNGDGDESSVITRTFYFTRIKEITYTLTGKAYSDNNCNAQKDADESYITDITTNLFKMPGFITVLNNTLDTDGTFTYSGKMLENEQASFSISLFGTNGYKSHPTYIAPVVTFTKDLRSITVESPAVPYQSVGQCAF